jgi:hydroxyethylthiazole kinase-like uncharacterized protein yjeF
MLKVDSWSRRPLHNTAATRAIEHAVQSTLPQHALMQRAGLAVARLALALVPHGQRIWVACGAGNNGGDGMEAAIHLQHWGKQPIVTWLGDLDRAPPDAAASYQRAIAQGVGFADTPPHSYDLCIDAMLGLGASIREPASSMAHWINTMNTGASPILAVDLPSGLQADTGIASRIAVRAQHTLSLITLKPGLFTADGRDHAGTVWLDRLDIDAGMFTQHEGVGGPSAWLAGSPAAANRPHNSHKGSYGDVIVVGGAPGMTGAALLAATAALHAGAGRVFVGLLDGGTLCVDTRQPELMFRPINDLDFKGLTVVCGCGGGNVVRTQLARILSSSGHAVIDADALNQIATDTQLQALLIARGKRHAVTVLTPHPLEAARLQGCNVNQIQSDRLAAASQIAQHFGCAVVLKGSGSVIAAPGQTPVINASGNPKLATAGTGDVLAGMVGAGLAAGLPAFLAACEAVYRHGQAADCWTSQQTLTADSLSRSLAL